MEKRLLIARWLGSNPPALPVYDDASVSAVRGRVRDAGQRLGLAMETIENAALIASELARNQLRHARQGYFAVHPLERPAAGLELIAADIGPGIAKPAAALRGGVPTEASLHAGLAAVCRIADAVDFDIRLHEGACVTARIFQPRQSARGYEAAVMGRPYPGEIVSGDDAVFLRTDAHFLAAVFDGLGHGPDAREASAKGVAVLCANADAPLQRIFALLNEELTATRGCAASIVRIALSDGAIEAAGAGDVHAHLYLGRDAHLFAAMPMVLGGGPLPKQGVRVETQPAAPGAVLALFSDGLKSKTSLKAQLDVLRLPAVAIAEYLVEYHARPDDDATVLVLKLPNDFPARTRVE